MKTIGFVCFGEINTPYEKPQIKHMFLADTIMPEPWEECDWTQPVLQLSSLKCRRSTALKRNLSKKCPASRSSKLW